MKLIAKGLFGSPQSGILTDTGISRKNRCSSESEQMVFLEVLSNCLVHITELATVALVEDNDYTLIKNAVAGILLNKGCQFLNGSNDDFCAIIFQLPLQHSGGGIAVCSTLLKAVVFLHSLVVQILTVDHKQHLVDVIQLGCQLCGLKGGQSLAAAGGVPNIAATGNTAKLFIVVGNLDSVNDPLRCNNLIGAHNQQQFFSRENAIPSQNVQDRMLCKECLGKVDQIRNDAVVGIRPKRGEFKAVAGLFLLCLMGIGIFDMVEPGGIGIVLGVGAVGDDEDLHKLIQTAGCPEAVPLIAVNLIESLADRHTPALQFDMYQRQAVDQDGHIIAIVVIGTIVGGYGVLIDDLQNIIVDILFIDQHDILAFAIVPLQHLHMVFLDQPGLFRNIRIGIGQHFLEEPIPLPVSELISIHLGKLCPEVDDQVSLLMDLQIAVAEVLEHTDKLLFQLCFTLVPLRPLTLRRIFSYNSAFAALSNNIEIAHFSSPPVVGLIMVSKNTN